MNRNLIETVDETAAGEIPELLGDSLGDPMHVSCAGLFVSRKDQDGVAPCTYAAVKGLRCCKLHFRSQGIVFHLAGNDIAASTVCVACDGDAKGIELVQCATCPVVWHRECLSAS